jgi:hypothetical protein
MPNASTVAAPFDDVPRRTVYLVAVAPCPREPDLRRPCRHHQHRRRPAGCSASRNTTPPNTGPPDAVVPHNCPSLGWMSGALGRAPAAPPERSHNGQVAPERQAEDRAAIVGCAR